ncbi:DUF4138 domain-containing protein [Eudoraea sp.]|uniref:DUF4138 domain-containing protein n=1 Tax=Eudoraea sp. TaxID=1979955 RepID=UPI003C76546F
MKGKLTLCSLLLLSLFAMAQNGETLDTIYANDQKNVALFFPNPIRQGITGASHFVFNYNREKEQYFGLLQAKPGTESNLLTITNDGQVYSYILKYADRLPKLNYFIAKEESIGNEKTIITPISQNQSITENIGLDSKSSNYQKLCAQLLKNQRNYTQIKQNKGIKVSMTKSIYHDKEVYVVFEISNNSNIDFDINTLWMIKTNGIKKRRTSYQEFVLSPIFRYNVPKTVPKGSKIQFVYVYSKFTLGKHDNLILKLDELNGSRDVVFEMKN